MYYKNLNYNKNMKLFLWTWTLKKWIKTRYWYLQRWTFCVIPHTQSFWYRLYFPKQNIKWEILHKNRINIVTKYTLSHVLKNKYLKERILGKSKLMKIFINATK